MNYEALSKDISQWIKDYAKNANLECLVVGVSGGIDSAVVSKLCANTGFKTCVLNIPIKSSKKNSDLSELHCTELLDKYDNVEYITVDATECFVNFLKAIGIFGEESDLANANSKSRMRMMILYYLATKNSGIVVGTGNKVEDFGVGFYTKYGDGGVDISPIADLSKTQVKELAAYLNVSQKILNAPPTDGLWEDSRTDESQIGASYEELEWAMNTQQNTNEMTKRQKEIFEIYHYFNKKNSHKMNSIPVFKIIGRKS